MIRIFDSEISESTTRTLKPLSEAKLDQLGRLRRLTAGRRQLDVACGKGEMLRRFALHHPVTGLGPTVRAAQEGAQSLPDQRRCMGWGVFVVRRPS